MPVTERYALVYDADQSDRAQAVEVMRGLDYDVKEPDYDAPGLVDEEKQIFHLANVFTPKVIILGYHALDSKKIDVSRLGRALRERLAFPPKIYCAIRKGQKPDLNGNYYNGIVEKPIDAKLMRYLLSR